MEADLEEAELVLALAFGWKAWVQLNKASYLKPKLPNPATIRQALQWLAEGPLHLGPQQIRFALSQRPTTVATYLGDPSGSYAKALETAPEQFSTPGSFREIVVQKPVALGLTWNCELTDPSTRSEEVHCDGQCTHCWRTATPGLMGRVLDGVEV